MYQIYTSNALFLINNNLIRMTGGYELNMRYQDIIHPVEVKQETEEEIKTRIFGKLKEYSEDNE